jgi:hypothetical protein
MRRYLLLPLPLLPVRPHLSGWTDDPSIQSNQVICNTSPPLPTLTPLTPHKNSAKMSYNIAGMAIKVGPGGG